MNVLDSFGINGKEAQAKLEEIGITTNKNMIPGDTLPPSKTSGIRIGFAASTTRGCTKDNAIEIAHIIYGYLKDNSSKEESLAKVHALTSSWKKIEEI